MSLDSETYPRERDFVLIDGFPIDITLSETATYDSDVTDYPVESGSNVTDNIRPKPIQLTLEGFVSDSPLHDVALKRGIVGQSLAQMASLPSADARKKLIGIYVDREPVTVISSRQLFRSMAMKTLSFPMSPGELHGLRFHATFVQIEIVSTNRATRVAVPRASGPVTNGNATTNVGHLIAGDEATTKQQPIRTLTRVLTDGAAGALPALIAGQGGDLIDTLGTPSEGPVSDFHKVQNFLGL